MYCDLQYQYAYMHMKKRFNASICIYNYNCIKQLHAHAQLQYLGLRTVYQCLARACAVAVVK